MNKDDIKLFIYISLTLASIVGAFFTMRSQVSYTEERVDKLEQRIERLEEDTKKAQLEFFKHGGWKNP